MAGSGGEPVKALHMAKTMEDLNKKIGAKNMECSTPKVYVCDFSTTLVTVWSTFKFIVDMYIAKVFQVHVVHSLLQISQYGC